MNEHRKKDHKEEFIKPEMVLVKNKRYCLLMLYYIRVSLIAGVIIGLFMILSCLFENEIYQYQSIFVILTLIFIVPAHLILPGLIYKPFKRSLPFKNGINIPIEQVVYYFLVVITIGIGPAIIYFKNFDKDLKEMCNDCD